MSDYTVQAQKAAESYLSTVAKAQDDLIKTVTAFVEQLPKNTEMPGAPDADVPTPSEVTAVSFDFAEKMIAQNRNYTEQLLAALQPAKV
ncbi:MAG: hypothetical protein ABIR83_02370 [Nakamurella sp.]